ncbi:MAG: penicillin-binding protein 1B [Pseudomonadota bacterium]|nr:MAG: penicillin-binding protein 1B [Pseudomonadota bacterium]
MSGLRNGLSALRRVVVGALALLAGVICGFVGGWSLYLAHAAVERFEARSPAQAGQVFARPLELYEGRPIAINDLMIELEAAGLRTGTPDVPGRFQRRDASFEIHLPGFDFPDQHQPQSRVRLTLSGDRVAHMDSSAGSLVRLPPAELDRLLPLDNRDRLPLPLSEFPPLLVTGAQAVEDRRFKHHHGLDTRAIARAAWVNLRSGQVVQGGSTITQQLARNLFLDHRRSWWRKFNEAVIALSLELRYDKAAILEAWLNEVYLGQDGKRAIHGFGRAAKHYFDRPVEALDVAQIALLVGMVRGASWYHPLRNPERARQRRDQVLDQFLQTGLIDQGTHTRARASGLNLAPSRGGQRKATAWLDLVRRQLLRDYREQDLRSAGLRIFTTLAPSLQARAEAALEEGLAAIERVPATLQGAVVVVEPASGDVLALVGDRVPGRSAFNRAIDARRSVGSVIKPLIYLLALSQPDRFTLVTPLQDRALGVPLADGSRWQPVNHDGLSHGTVPLMEALAQSYNQATVRLGLDIGIGPLYALMQQSGVAIDHAPHPAALLGAVSLSPLQVAQLYQPLAADGFTTPLNAVARVVDQADRTIARYRPRLKPVQDRSALALVDYALRYTVTDGTARRMPALLAYDPGVRGKTGTTNDRRDAWFVGYTPDALGVVWVGRDDHAPAGVSGAAAALPIWARLFDGWPMVPVRRGWPDDVEWYWVDWPRPELSREGCPGALALPFIAGSQPTVSSDCRSTRRPR